MASNIAKDYGTILKSLKEKIRQARLRATIAVNNQLLVVYWEIGNTILLQQKSEGWGTKVIDRLVNDLKLEFPDMKGLSPRNIKYMRAFADAFPHFTIVQSDIAQLQHPENDNTTIVQRTVAQLPWGHICTLLDKLKSSDERFFYAQKAIKSGWTRDMLVNQIESGLYKRQGALINNFQVTLPVYESELAKQLFKDPYHLDFVMLGEEARERDLENALMNHLTKLLLELGDGFAFMGRQKKFEAGGREFFVDLLFYHTKLRRHIIIELKIGEFEPEFVSKMNLYLGLADDSLKGEYDEPAIGLILCKINNKIIAEYALRDTSKPIGIAEYKIAEMLPEDIKGELPSIEEIEQLMDEELKEKQSPVESRLQAIKDKLKNIQSEEIQTAATFDILNKLYHEGLKPLYKKLTQKLSELNDSFHSKAISWTANNKGIDNYEELDAFWNKEENLKNIREVHFTYTLYGFKKAGTQNLSEYIDLKLEMTEYWYGFTLNNIEQPTILKKLFHQSLTEDDQQLIIDTVMTKALDSIEGYISRIDNQ